MGKAWLIDSRGIARKVRNATQLSKDQIKDLGIEANRQCPNCSYRIDNSDVSLEWPGLPAGVKFDPSDAELLEHLAGKLGIGNCKPHAFIDEFIPTLDKDEGICYTHPENLPGIKKDGTSAHFFHTISNAYSTGQRKRRKVHEQCILSTEHVRWHKTGKTKRVIENGVHKGWKKIMVLYKSSRRGSKPDKSNWVMHQYHLGAEEDENEGEFVVSKIFYQQQSKQMMEKAQEKQVLESLVIEESDNLIPRASPKTPKTRTPHRPRSEKSTLYEDADDDIILGLSDQDTEFNANLGECLPSVHLGDDSANPAWLVEESKGVSDSNLVDMDESLLCNEMLDPFSLFSEAELNHLPPYLSGRSHQSEPPVQALNVEFNIPDFEKIEVDLLPDLQLADLQFGSQESIMGWLDRL